MLEMIILAVLVVIAICADVASLAMLRGVRAANGGVARSKVAVRVTVFEGCALSLGWLIGRALSSYDPSLARWIGLAVFVLSAVLLVAEATRPADDRALRALPASLRLATLLGIETSWATIAIGVGSGIAGASIWLLAGLTVVTIPASIFAGWRLGQTDASGSRFLLVIGAIALVAAAGFLFH
jgi:putative Mn2+ efflux pump MntP